MGASFRSPSRPPETHLDVPDNVLVPGYATIADGAADFVQGDEIGPPGGVCVPPASAGSHLYLDYPVIVRRFHDGPNG